MSVEKIGSVTITGPLQGTSSTLGTVTNSVTTLAMDRPYTLADMDVDTALSIEAVERKLQIEATLDSVMTDVGQDVVYTGKKITLPDACVMRLKTMEKGAKTQVIPMLRPMAGPGRGGTGEAQQGYERGMILKFMKVYYNEYSQALAGEEWGVNFNGVNVFNLYSNIQPMLSRWFKEDTDKQYHEALLQTFAWPLVKTGAGLTDGTSNNWNPNWYIANTAFGSQPSYDSTKGDMTQSIATAMEAAATGTAGVNANIDLDTLLAMGLYAEETLRLTPVTIGGRASYIFLCPSRQYHKLMSNAAGQLGEAWEKVTALSDEEQKYPGIVGRVGNLVIIKDPRYPTIEADKYSATPTFTVEYVEPGNDDNRNKTVYSSSNLAWDIGFILGANALVDWEVTPLHFEMEKTEYGKLYGKGAFTERGIQLAMYDQDTQADDTRLNFGSCAVAFTATNVVSVA